MILFIDTEFTDFKDSELISLGLVSECGQHEFYVEIIDYPANKQSEFVKDNIVPLLDHEKFGMLRRPAEAALKDWINHLPAGEIVVVADYYMDLELFGEFVKKDPPKKRMLGQDIFVGMLHALHERGYHNPNDHHLAFKALKNRVDEYYALFDKRRHHALVDARANRHGWQKGFEDINGR